MNANLLPPAVRRAVGAVYCRESTPSRASRADEDLSGEALAQRIVTVQDRDKWMGRAAFCGGMVTAAGLLKLLLVLL